MSDAIARPWSIQYGRCAGVMMGSHPSMRMMRPSGGDCLILSAASTAAQCVFSWDLVCMIVMRFCSSSAL